MSHVKKGTISEKLKTLSTDLPAFNAELKRLGLDPVTTGKPVVF